MVHSLVSRPRSRRRQAMTEDIVSVALDLLVERGHEGLTMQSLATELGCAAGGLYRYFRSKEEILVAVVSRALTNIRADLDEALLRTDAHVERSGRLGPADVALLRLVVAAQLYRSMLERRPTELRLINWLLGDPRFIVDKDVATEVLLPSVLALAMRVEALFAEAAGAGALHGDDSGRRALLFWSSLQGVLQLAKLERFELAGLDASELAHQQIHITLLGLGADASRLTDSEQRAARILRALDVS